MEPSSKITLEALLAHSDWMRRLVAGLVFDSSRADDVLQETWLVALKRPPQQDLDLRAWLATVARNVIKNLGRGESRRKCREKAVARVELLPDVIDVHAKAQLHGRMVKAVLALDEPYRTPVLLRFFEELPPREIAVRLARPVNTVRTQLARGLDRLRAELDVEYGDRDFWGMAFLPLLALSHDRASSPVGGSLLLKTGGVLMLWKLTLPVVAIAIALFVWSASERNVAPHEQKLVADAERTSLAEPDSTLTSRTTALLKTSSRESLAHKEEPKAASQARAYPLEGLAVNVRGEPLTGLSLLIQDESGPKLVGDKILFYGTLQEFTPELRELQKTGTPEARQAIQTLLDENALKPPLILTDASGRFATSVSFLNARLVPQESGYCSLGYGVRSLLPSSETERVYVFAQTRRFEGRVVDEQGTPIAGVTFTTSSGTERISGFPYPLTDSSQRGRWNAISDETGLFFFEEFPLVPGGFVEAEKVGYKQQTLRRQESSSEFVDVVLHKVDQPYVIAGRVLGPSGLGVDGATVTFGQYSATSSALGYFTLEMDQWASGGELIALKPGLTPAVLHSFGERLKAAPVVDRDIVLQLGPPTRSISGKVVDPNGTPLPGIRLLLRGGLRDGASGSDAEAKLAGPSDSHRVSSSDGGFEITGLFARSYGLVACDMATFVTNRIDNIVPGTHDLVLVLDPGNRIPKVRGRVVDRHGRSVPSATLHAALTMSAFGKPGYETRMSRALGLGQTDEDGHFELRDVPVEGVTFKVSGTGIKATEFDLSDRDDQPLELVVPLELLFQFAPNGSSGADSLAVIDAEGEELHLVALTPGRTAFHLRYRIGNRETLPTFRVSDAATELVLYAGKNIVRRIPLDLRIGEIAQLR